MLDIEATSLGAKSPPLQITLWRCERCNSFVSIHSLQLIDDPICPLCGMPLEFCGMLSSIFGIPLADA